MIYLKNCGAACTKDADSACGNEEESDGTRNFVDRSASTKTSGTGLDLHHREMIAFLVADKEVAARTIDLEAARSSSTCICHLSLTKGAVSGIDIEDCDGAGAAVRRVQMFARGIDRDLRTGILTGEAGRDSRYRLNWI